MYSHHRWEKIRQQVQGLLSQKRRPFSLISIPFLKSTQNFAHFEKKHQLHSLKISEVIELHNCGYFNARKLLFKTPFTSKRVFGYQTLLEPALQHFCLNFLLI